MGIIGTFFKSPYTNLGNIFQPPTKGNKHNQHWRSLKESHWRPFILDNHGNHNNSTGIDVGDSGCHHNQEVHG